MKKILFSISFLLLASLVFAQGGNGGQYGENTNVVFRYIGFSNGYIVNIKNKQECPVNFQFSWLNHDSTSVFVAPGDSVTYTLPEQPVNGTPLKVKPLVNCTPGGGDMGWLEINAPNPITVLPIKFGFVKVDPNRTANGNLRITYQVLTATGDNTVYINLRRTTISGKVTVLRIPLAKQYATEGIHTVEVNDRSH